MVRLIAKWSPLRKLAAVAVLGGAIFVFYMLGVSWYRSYRVEQELQRLRSAGVPVTAEELNDYVAIPVGEPNATAAWMKPMTMIDGGMIGWHPYGFDVLDRRGYFPPLPGEDWPKLESAEAYIARHQSLFDAVDLAVATPGKCCFITDYSGGALILLPHAQWGRLINRLLTLRAYVHAHRADQRAVLVDIHAMLRSASSLADEPIEVTQLVHNVQLRQVTTILERLLPHCDPSSSLLEQLQRELATVDTRRGLRLASFGHRVMGLTTFADPSTAGAKMVPSPLYRAWVDDDELSLLQTMREVDDQIAGDWPQPLHLAGRFADATSQAAEVSAPLGRGDWFAPSKWAESLGADVTHFAIAQACASSAAAGIAAFRCRAREGSWPESLGELVPHFLSEVPIDPFTGKPLNFRIVDGEIRIYSVGPNLKDDGGVESPVEDADGNLDYNGEPDVVFRVPMR